MPSMGENGFVNYGCSSEIDELHIVPKSFPPMVGSCTQWHSVNPGLDWCYPNKQKFKDIPWFKKILHFEMALLLWLLYRARDIKGWHHSEKKQHK